MGCEGSHSSLVLSHSQRVGQVMLWILLAAYLCGSIPFGLVIVRAVAGVDLRKVGSGNIGATNAGRVVGKTWGIVVLLLDALKGAGPTCLAPWFAESLGLAVDAETARVLAGATAILGHMFPVWLGFRGGKGVATALGVVAVLAWIPTLAAAVVFAVAVGIKRIVSLGSILAALTFAGVQLWLLRPQPFGAEHRSLALFALAIPVLIVVRHAGNIVRLMRGEEPTFQSAHSRSEHQETAPDDPPQ